MPAHAAGIHNSSAVSHREPLTTTLQLYEVLRTYPYKTIDTMRSAQKRVIAPGCPKRLMFITEPGMYPRPPEGELVG
jgi:hypothetical protein